MARRSLYTEPLIFRQAEEKREKLQRASRTDALPLIFCAFERGAGLLLLYILYLTFDLALPLDQLDGTIGISTNRIPVGSHVP